MNDLPLPAIMADPSTPISMSSREIAQLARKRHGCVKRLIESLVAKNLIAQPPMGNESNLPRAVPVYRFAGPKGKRDSIVVAAHLSPKIAGELVDRREILEQAVCILAAIQAEVGLPAAEQAQAASSMECRAAKKDREAEGRGLAGYLYAIESKRSGLVKVGRSKNPARRINQILRASKADGRIYISPGLANAPAAEARVKKAMRDESVGNEWFAAGFDDVVTAISGLMGEVIDEETVRARNASVMDADGWVDSVIRRIEDRFSSRPVIAHRRPV